MNNNNKFTQDNHFINENKSKGCLIWNKKSK